MDTALIEPDTKPASSPVVDSAGTKPQIDPVDLAQHFASLPDDAGVSDAVVAAVIGVHRASIWRMAQKGALPKPVKLGRTSRWRVGTIRAVMNGMGA